MTDMITVSRKEIEKLRNLTRYSFLSPSEGGVRRFQDKSGAWVEHYEMFKIIEDLLDKAEVSEPVADAINERSRLGYTVVKVIGKLDEIIENTQEVEIDDFLHIAVPIDMWGELQESLEDMPKRAYLYTSPPDQSAKIAELEAEIVRLKAIIEDIKVIDNVFGKGE